MLWERVTVCYFYRSKMSLLVHKMSTNTLWVRFGLVKLRLISQIFSILSCSSLKKKSIKSISNLHPLLLLYPSSPNVGRFRHRKQAQVDGTADVKTKHRSRSSSRPMPAHQRQASQRSSRRLHISDRDYIISRITRSGKCGKCICCGPR